MAKQFGSAHILRMGNPFHVGGVYAMANAAQMVTLQAGRDGATSAIVSEDMSRNRASWLRQPKRPVSVAIASTLPEMAPTGIDYDLRVEPLINAPRHRTTVTKIGLKGSLGSKFGFGRFRVGPTKSKTADLELSCIPQGMLATFTTRQTSVSEVAHASILTGGGQH